MRAFGISDLEFDLAVVAIALIVCVTIIRRLLDGQPYICESPVPFTGKVGLAEEQPEFHAQLTRISETVGCPAPDTVIFGLEPGIRCTQSRVDLDGQEISGRTLYVSLPLCRLLSEAELKGLIAEELARCERLPTDWDGWIMSAYHRWSPTMESDHAGFFNPLRLWMEQWGKWSFVASFQSVQRSVILAGFQNVGLGFALTELASYFWKQYCNQIPVWIWEGTLQIESRNLSKGFAEFMRESADAISARYLADGADREVLPPIARLLGTDMVTAGQRIAAGPADSPTGWFADVERMEVELSRQQIRRGFFV